MRIAGVWQDDKRFGMQVKVRLAEPVAPSGEVALMAYLKRVKHIGGGRAAKLLERYGEGVLEAIDADPAGAFRAPGSTSKRTNEAIRSWNALRSTRALHLLLAPHGLAWLVPRIAAEYGDRAHEVVRTRPYELTSVFGVGFHIADTIARAAGVPRDSVGRTRAAVIHVLTEAERDGSTCLPVAELATQRRDAARRAGARRGAAAGHARRRPARARAATTRWSGPTARRPRRWRPSWRRRSTPLAVADAALEAPEPLAAEELVPAPEQWAAVQAAFGSRLSIVTGGPGTGQDRDDPADLRGGEGPARVGRARRADRPRRAPDGRVDRRGGLDDPLRARLDPRPGADARRDRRRPARGRRDVDGQPRAARHAAAGGRAGHARRARRRRRPARAGRRRQAVRGAGRGPGGPGGRAHAHLPPGGGEHDRARRARGPPGPAAVVRGHRGPAARPVPDRARRPARGAGRDRLARHRAPARRTTASTR